MPPEDLEKDVASGDDVTTTTGDGVDWDTIYKTPQFQSIVADYKKRAKAAEAALAAQQEAQAKAAEDELKEQAKWQQLYETTEAAAAKLKAELQQAHASMARRERQLAIQDAARNHEPPFIPAAIGDVLLLIQADDLPDGDDLPKAAQAKVKALAESKPWLLQTVRSDPGSPPGRKPAGGTGKPNGTGKPLGL